MDLFGWWNKNFGLYAPRGHILRSHQYGHWTRIHSLPESKRYPDTPREYDILLQRHNELADFLFQPGETCILFKSNYFCPEDNEQERPVLDGVIFSTEHIILPQYPGEIPIEQDDLYSIWCAQITWKPSFFSSLVRAVADEEIVGVTIVSMVTRNVYCPYDGGADVFTFDSPPVVVREQFSSWLSGRSDGL